MANTDENMESSRDLHCNNGKSAFRIPRDTHNFRPAGDKTSCGPLCGTLGNRDFRASFRNQTLVHCWGIRNSGVVRRLFTGRKQACQTETPPTQSGARCAGFRPQRLLQSGFHLYLTISPPYHSPHTPPLPDTSLNPLTPLQPVLKCECRYRKSGLLGRGIGQEFPTIPDILMIESRPVRTALTEISSPLENSRNPEFFLFNF